MGLGNISRKIAQCVTELATAAEQLKDEDWVNPSDPNWIAENELLGAAKATSALIRAATEAQRELVTQGKVSKSTNTLTEDGQWSEGLVSAARMVAAATHNLCEAANALVQ